MDYDSEDHGPQVVVIATVILSIVLLGLIVGGLGLFFLHNFWWFGVGISGGIIGWIIVYIIFRFIPANCVRRCLFHKRPGEKK